MSMLPSQAGKTSVITKSSSPKVGMVSLGCAKALVDSERIITQLKTEGYDIAPDYKGADIVLVNTCGFLDSARAESLDAIGEAMAENGKVIVTGCLGAEPEVIRARFPHVLDITGPQQYESVMKAVHKALPPLHDPYLDIVPPQGVRLTPRHYAYLKISEGCNNRCSFCIIPSLRGDLVSRTTADILDEAEKLVASGVRELLIISQDTSAYGVDIKYAASNWRGREVKANLVELCKALSELGVWVRLHYVYPYPSVDAVIPLMRDGLILPYLDIPFQHASPAVLKNMRRPANQEKTAERINKWREICPSLTLRSTFIVGFPGETEEDFSYLLNWLKEVQIDRLGCFKYEDVKGAPSHHIEGHVSETVKQERYDRLMALQQEISAAKLLKKIGTIQKVLVDEIRDGKAIGRSATDAPDIDGCIIFSPQRRARIGEFAQVEITDTDAYDMYGIESVTV